MGKLFGTDGIRGVAGTGPMTPEMAVTIGKAIAVYFTQHLGDQKQKIVIGKDTRISGDMLEAGLVAGITAMGVDACCAGVLPTPAIACLAASKEEGYAAGIMISASHNPWFDNGIKLFRSDGYKLTDPQEEIIESLIFENRFPKIEKPGVRYDLQHGGTHYVNFLKENTPQADLKPLKVVLDCSNGATFKTAPKVFESLGMGAETLFAQPDGFNINESCGSQHPETLAEKVLELKADAGFAFDGDGDRLIAVTEKGEVMTGDQILAVCAKFAKMSGTLKNDTVVTTVMSNIGLGAALKNLGIKHVTSDVGDRYVALDMIKSGSIIGGEDSGHMIFMDCHTTGDGIYTALKLVEILSKSSETLSELARVMKIYPQKLENVAVKTKPDLSEIPEIATAIRSAEEELGGRGRVLIRYSGTQSVCRVMVEASTEEETEKYCRRLVEQVKKSIG